MFSISGANTLVWQDAQQQIVIEKQFDDQAPVFKNLQICYECEFSPITGTQAEPDGSYNQQELRSHWADNWDAYVLYVGRVPAGFCVVNHASMTQSRHDDDRPVHDVAEFYIAPLYRRAGYGSCFARQIFQLYPGHWEVRQLPELAQTSRLFWHAVIRSLVGDVFQEVQDSAQWAGFIQFFDI